MVCLCLIVNKINNNIMFIVDFPGEAIIKRWIYMYISNIVGGIAIDSSIHNQADSVYTPD